MADNLNLLLVDEWSAMKASAKFCAGLAVISTSISRARRTQVTTDLNAQGWLMEGLPGLDESTRDVVGEAEPASAETASA